MLSTPASVPLQFRYRPGALALLRSMIDPTIAVITLVATALWFNGQFGRSYLILSLLVFAMTFPSSLAREHRPVEGARALLGEILGGWLVIVTLLLLLGWATRALEAFEPKVLLAWTFASPLAIFATHRLLAAAVPRLLAVEGLRRVAVIAGANDIGRRLAARIEADPMIGVRLAGFFDDREAHRLEPATAPRALGKLTELADYAKREHIDVIYIALPMCSQPRIHRLLTELHDTTASIYFAPDIFLYDLIQARVDSIGGMPVLAVCESPFVGMNAVVKRASDVVLASAILILIAPLMAAIAAAIKLGSPGPALFRQRRYGLDGREIVVYKFRSMRCLEDGEQIRQATRDDNRVTPLGAFLRRYSLDELPQFINVLQGRMSVVGPRPHAVAHNEMYRKLIRGYMIRHKVRPGITGLAQVNGLRGETETVEKMTARIECDLAYLRSWSLLLDLRIVLRTILVVLRPANAY